MGGFCGAGIAGVAVVTGGGSGIGAEACRELAARGASIAILDRNFAPASEVAGELNGRAFEADIGDEVALARLADEIEATMGPIEVLVNSAGITQQPRPAQHMPIDEWDEVVRVDQRGTFVACVAFGKMMLARRKGSIVNIASITGMRSVPLHSYGPAKAAVIAMTANLAAEWGPANVRVNTISPGYTLTPLLRDLIEKGERDPSMITACQALQRLVEPKEVARAIGFLASDDASGITGVNLPVDCGWLVAPSWQTFGGLRDAGV